MNAASIIQRLRQKVAVTNVMSPPVISAEPYLFGNNITPSPYEIAPIPPGPGVDQFNALLEILPPLSIEWGPWMAGGAVRRILQGRAIDDGDVDFFFSDASEYLKFDRALQSYEEVHTSPRARTFLVNGLKVQIIKRKFYKDLKEVFGDFDFTVCQVATDGKKIAHSPRAIQDINDSRLRIAEIGRVSKLTVVGRLVKYVNHGFVPDCGLFRMIVESGLDVTGAHKIFDQERPSANYDHDAKVEECLDAKVFNSDALREAAARLGVELPA